MGHIYTNLDCDYDLIKDYSTTSGLLNWLKNSCIKTKAGDDLVCYHGSPSKETFKIFNDNSGYGCESFTGFFSLNYDFAESYTYDGSNLGSGNVRRFAINSKKLFDIKDPACVRFLKTNLTETIICRGYMLDKDSFVNYLRTEQLPINNYKLTVDKFTGLQMFDKVDIDILGESGWEYSCSLEADKQLQNRYFLGVVPASNSVFVLDYYNRIMPKISSSYRNRSIDGIRLDLLLVTFDKAVEAGIITEAQLNKLSQGVAVNIQLSEEEFIKVCSYDEYSEFTETDRQILKNILNNSSYDDLDLSVNVTLSPNKISLDEFSLGLSDTISVIDLSNDTWKLYEGSYCIIDNQKIHIIDWLKNEGFDAIVVKEDWAVNIICFYKNMIKVITNRKPTNSDNVYETYNYSDALLDDLI